MKLVRQIRDNIVNPDISLATVLRQAKILAASLKNEEFKAWLSEELNGYDNREAIPSYRYFKSPPLGTFSGPFGQVLTHYQLPISFMPENVKKWAKDIALGNSIKEIEAMISSDSKELRHPWPPEAAMLLRDKIPLSGGFELVEIYQPISKANLEGMIEAVRNKLLDFVLALQEIEPTILDSEAALEKIPSDTITKIYNVNIQGDHNILASGNGIKQTVTHNIPENDIETLLKHFSDLGIEKNDINSLKSALEKDGKRPKGNLGENVKAWIGKIISKGIEGTWKTAIASAPSLISQAIAHYYGW